MEGVQTVLDLLSLQTRQAAQGQGDDGLRLLLGQSGVLVGGEFHQIQLLAAADGAVKALHQIDLSGGGVGGGSDDGNDLVDVVQRQLVALVDVGIPQGGGQIELHAVGDDRFLVLDVVVQDLGQIQHLGLILDNGQHIDGAGILELGVAVELIQHHVAVGLSLEVDDDAHTVAVGLVADIRDTVHPLILDQITDGGAEHALVDAVGDLGDDDLPLVLLHLGGGADHDVALTRHVGFLDAVGAVNGAVGGEVGALNELHQLGDGAVGVVHAVDGGINDLTQIVGGDVGGHTDGDTHGAVDKQVGEAGRQDLGLLQTVVEVGHHGDHVLVHIPHHLGGDLLHSRLGITVSRRRVTVHRAEVTLTLDQRVQHVEGLSQVYHGTVHRAVAVRMVPTQHRTDGGSRLAEGFIVGQMILIHGVEHTSLTGLHAVAHVG